MTSQLATGLFYLEIVARLALVAWTIWGLTIVVRTPEHAFVAEGKWPKKAWLAIFGVSLLMFAILPVGGLGILMVVAIVAIGVFFADVRPAVAGYRRQDDRQW